MTWLSDAEQIANARSRGATYVVDESVPWKFCVHTTEVVPSSLTGAKSLAGRHEYPPHLWAWPERNWVGQTVPLDRAAFALLHPDGTPPTNKLKVIQVEVIGKAAETPRWPDEWWLWLGRRVLRPVIDAGYPINLDRVARTIGPEGYGLNGAVRMSRAAFRAFDGVLCHANVPDNKHWDVGAGRLDLIAHGARLAAPTPATSDESEEDEDMAGPIPEFIVAPQGHATDSGKYHVHLVSGLCAALAAEDPTVSQLKGPARGLVEYQYDAESWDALKAQLAEIRGA